VASESESDAFIEKTRRTIQMDGTASFMIDDLAPSDLARVWWTGNPAHLRNIEAALARVATGQLDYLAVRAPDGTPVAVGKIDYLPDEQAGMLSQLVTHWLLQGHGLGTRLIEEAERRILGRGFTRSLLGVETDNLRASSLYERLGYRAYGRDTESWEEQNEDGTVRLHTTEFIQLEKALNTAASHENWHTKSST
jgi:ribosomal protein S18 acetylase RimI-like enzyme